MNALIHVETWDVNKRLAELGLDQEGLRDVVQRGHLAYITCTANHPPMVPAIWAWGETVRALREHLLPKGWERSDDNNYSTVIDPTKQFVIAVCAGDEGTGRPDATPSNKTPKGPSTMDAIAANQFQLGLPLEFQTQPTSIRPTEGMDDRVTRILLVYRSTKEVRCELSLPSSIGIGGRIDNWRERILLGTIPLDGDLIEIAPPELQGITVDVKRKA